MKLKNRYVVLLFALGFLGMGCNDDMVLIGDPVTALNNDCIKRSLPVAPNLIGQEIEFAYAMALPEELGNLTSAQVVASIPGGAGTYFDPNSYYTNASGEDVAVLVASESQTSGGTTSIQFSADTCAATLRFYYIIPEEARGKEVSFVFSVKASNGQSAEYKMGPYKISEMDMTRSLLLTSDEQCYISFRGSSEAAVIYSKTDLDADPSLASQIDLVYARHSSADISHALYAADAPEAYRPDVVFPSGFSSQTKMIKEYGLRDRQLSDLQYSHFIDDLDFETINMDRSTNYVLALKEEAGVWVETADASYRAFIFINNAGSSGMTISVKRYKM
ncbi:DUF4466 family protein [Parapedobacter soli]|uniref:DUF4466 family protein n=1 Tax=Parapedobacter soli TaxID=416955 RepID=UPI0021C5F0B7|nr:DUF4466 family protein [Parapedobacter soli]